MMEILAHIPCPPINVRFLNRTMELRLVHGEAQSPEQFLHYAAQEINRVFQASPSGTTPYVQRYAGYCSAAGCRRHSPLRTDSELRGTFSETVGGVWC